MDRRRSEGGALSSELVDGGSFKRSASSTLQPNYNSRAAREALEHLASIDLIELCNEAKVEHCRATRDLRSCGRYVEYLLNSCGHASLCAECSQRCDLCPVCRTPISENGDRVRLRLYHECIEAGLIAKRYDGRFQEKDGEEQLSAVVQRLYSLFDVAMENNLVSLICHYVTDVCLDESAVSSDPTIAFLLDEVVVKDWCKWTFGNIITDFRGIYALEAEEMTTRLGLLPKFLVQLTGISNVLEVLESSFKGTLSAQLHDLHHLQENVSKAKQHLEIMTWCIRHQFLENVTSCYSNFTSWCSLVRERKSAATKRSWPDSISNSTESAQQGRSLFIEDALSNLEMEQMYGQGLGEELEVTSLQKDGASSSFFRSEIEGVAGCYPFENLRAAADILFLQGRSDMAVAKRAIFLYYLFDRHWTTPDVKWRQVVDDFAATFGITRRSVLESLTFYLLDDHTDQALQEACRLLPEIAGPTTHPKIAQVLLERQNPDAALMVLRWSGRDGLCAYVHMEHGEAQLVPLGEAVTAVRVRVECGLLTEAFMYQRTHCMKVKEENLKHGSPQAFSNGLKGQYETWLDRMEVLMTEICCLCIRRNLVDRMIELPWNSDEERYLHRCLLEYATEDPLTTAGSLLVVFYLQRYRYLEANQVDRKLQILEQDFISKTSISEVVMSRMRSTSHWRTVLINKCIELLPEVQRQQVKAESWPDVGVSAAKKLEIPVKSDHHEFQQPHSNGYLVPSTTDSSLVLRMDHTIPSKKNSSFDTPAKLGGSVRNSHIELSNYRSPSILHGRLLTTVGDPSTPHNRDNLGSSHISVRELRPQISTRQDHNFGGIPTPGIHLVSPQNSTSLKEVNRVSSMVLQNYNLREKEFDKVSLGMEQNGFINQVENTCSLYPRRVIAKPMSTPGSNYRLLNYSARDPDPILSHKPVPSERPRTLLSSDDPMDASWSNGNIDSTNEVMNANNGLRWRSDEVSEDEEEPSSEITYGGASFATPVRARRSRFARR